MAKEIVAENKIENTDRVVNTLDSIKVNKSDAELAAAQFKKAKGISKGPRKKFKCSSVYATMYPNGLITTYQGIIIELNFDNSVIELPEVIVDYIEAKLQRKADKEAEKLNNFVLKKQDKIGEYQAE